MAYLRRALGSYYEEVGTSCGLLLPPTSTAAATVPGLHA